MTYGVPGPNFEWMREPYSPEQIKKFYLKEAAALSDKKGKRKASKEYDAYTRKRFKKSVN